MPIELQQELQGETLIVRMTGKLRKEDYATFLPAVEEAIRTHGKVRMLVDMHDFHGWSAGGLWEDVKFDAKHFNDIERMAVVGGEEVGVVDGDVLQAVHDGEDQVLPAGTDGGGAGVAGGGEAGDDLIVG